MVKQEIYKINDFSTLAGRRRPIYLNKFGQACWALHQSERNKQTKKSLQFTPNAWHFRGNDTKTIALCPPESFTKKKKSAADSQIVETGTRACERVVCRGNKSAFYRMEATKRVVLVFFSMWTNIESQLPLTRNLAPRLRR